MKIQPYFPWNSETVIYIVVDFEYVCNITIEALQANK